MNNITALKRYQIAKVYRRDNPSKGRYREFYQCDLDIAGQHETMEPDFEVVKVLTELLDELNIGDYEIKLNHRKLLDGMLEICGVSSEKFRTVCSSIDKLDKQSFEQIKKELVKEKGLAIDTAEKIGSFVKKRGPPLEILSNLKVDGSQFMENTGSVTALQELEILFKALEKSKCLDKVVFDLSLARGLDYYTGVIFEAVFKGATQVGSIIARKMSNFSRGSSWLLLLCNLCFHQNRVVKVKSVEIGNFRHLLGSLGMELELERA